MKSIPIILVLLVSGSLSCLAQTVTTPVTRLIHMEIPDTLPDQAQQVIVYHNQYNYEIHHSHQSGDRVYWQQAEVQMEPEFDRYTYYWDSRNTAVIILFSSSNGKALRFKVFSNRPNVGGMSFDP